ncbi:hypothetical protein SAY87_015975 [Trapa incisa]|uniref:RING-type E3 ubiquitin transferase n=1 Tax=Trapa incisa TaxID=236973 RepID=A0AAN7QU20_9MYRT|nr:hypothetical protein SAY87_015975 [Trapa incisa]
MDSSRSGRRAIPRCRNQLSHDPHKKASVMSRICSNDSANAALNPAARSNSQAIRKFRLIMIGKGLGCMASISSVKEAAVVRFGGTKAERTQGQKKRKDQRLDERTEGMDRRVPLLSEAETSPAIAGICCGPGILFSSDAAFVDCIQSMRRPAAVTMKQTEEVVLHFSPLYEQIPSAFDRFREWRLDIDYMSYEELLDLSDRIGYEDMGLKKNEMLGCLMKARSQMEEMLPLLLHAGGEWKCSICHDGFEPGNETGRLDCGHSYHIRCLKQWLRCKNSCPICKDEAIPYRRRLAK